MSGNRLADDDSMVILLIKPGGERYVFHYDDSSKSECLRVLGQFAANADLSFNWHDAAVLSQRIREEAISRREAVDGQSS